MTGKLKEDFLDMQTVSVVAIIGVICSIILSIGFPIMLLVVGKKKFHAKISSFFVGAGTFILFVLVLERILHWFVISKLGLNAQNHEWLYYVYAAAAASVFEETGRIIAMKFFMKKSLDFPNAFMYGIGHGGIEAIIIGGLANISNLITMIMINGGLMQMSLAALSEDMQAQIIEQLSVFWTTSEGLFFVSGFERISAVILHIGLSLIIYRGLQDRKKIVIAIAYGMHFVVDFFAVSCASRIPVLLLELVVFALAVGTFLLSHKLNKGEKA